MITGTIVGFIIGTLISWFLAKLQVDRMQEDVIMLMDETKKAQKYAVNSQGYTAKAQEATKIAQDLTIKAQQKASRYKILYKGVNEREQYLLKMVNEAMTVVDTKGFIRQRMENAPFAPIDYEDNRPTG